MEKRVNYEIEMILRIVGELTGTKIKITKIEMKVPRLENTVELKNGFNDEQLLKYYYKE